VFSRAVFGDFMQKKFPNFFVGIFRWDNWIFSEFIINSEIDTIDATGQIYVIHQNENVILSHWKRNGSTYNHNLAIETSGEQFRIGNMNYTSKRLVFDSELEIIPNRNLKRDKEKILIFGNKNHERNVILVFVNSDSIPQAVNLICSIKRNNVQNVVLLAQDPKIESVFRELKLPIISAYGESSFMQNGKALKFLNKVLLMGLNFLLVDSNSVMFSDPLKQIDSSADVQGFFMNNKLSPNFLYIKSTPSGRNFLRSYRTCAESNSKNPSKGKNCLDKSLSTLKTTSTAAFKEWDSLSISSISTKSSNPEVGMHFTRSTSSSLLKRRNLWFVDDSCKI
jgi:hypothetical protein